MAKTTLEDYGYKQELKRSVGIWGVIAYGMIFINPMAALILYGYVAPYSHGMDSLVYVVGLAGMLFTALSYIKMMREFPIAGSVFSYIQRAVNPHVGFLTGWLILLDYALMPALVMALAASFLSILIPAIPFWLSIVIFVVFNTVVNVLGIEWGNRANFGLLALELSAILAFVITGAVFVAKGGGAGGMTIAPLWQVGKVNLNFVATAASIAVAAFLGFDAMTTLAEETEKSSKVIPRGIIAALAIMGFLFILESYMADIIHPGFQGLNPDTGLFTIATLAAGGYKWLQIWLLITLTLSLGVGTGLNSQVAAARILFSMGRDQTLPSILSKVHPRFQTPYVATICFGIVTCVLAISLSIDRLISFVNFGAMSAFFVLNISVIWYFFIKKGERKGIGVWHYLIAPIMGAVVIGYVWYGLRPDTKMLGFTWIGLGVIYGLIQSKGYKVAPTAIKDI